eukprot:3202809-Pleurochrysis_carterae.AAC.1
MVVEAAVEGEEVMAPAGARAAGAAEDVVEEAAVAAAVEAAALCGRRGLDGRVRLLSSGKSAPAAIEGGVLRAETLLRLLRLPVRPSNHTLSFMAIVAGNHEILHRAPTFLDIGGKMAADKGARRRLINSQFLPPLLPVAIWTGQRSSRRRGKGWRGS